LFGLTMGAPAPEFLAKWKGYIDAVRLHGVNVYATSIGVGGIIVIWLMRKYAPRIPAAIVAVVLAAMLVTLFHLDDKNRFGPAAVETIGTKFGGVPRDLPKPQVHSLWTAIRTQPIRELIPEATTIALLAAIESLLCCVVADGMIGGRHKSNCELVAQGVGNIASILFGGIPATGAIARTAANVKSGGHTPLAGMVHSVFILIVMLALAPLAT